mmetsp:Transcript_12388/g.29129  ORF Transcript_12388/g.29129 Transcript_12388/m.29129 type:complete len:205 (+) Transcript_12388:171-785(+)
MRSSTIFLLISSSVKVKPSTQHPRVPCGTASCSLNRQIGPSEIDFASNMTTSLSSVSPLKSTDNKYPSSSLDESSRGMKTGSPANSAGPGSHMETSPVSMFTLPMPARGPATSSACAVLKKTKLCLPPKAALLTETLPKCLSTSVVLVTACVEGFTWYRTSRVLGSFAGSSSFARCGWPSSEGLPMSQPSAMTASITIEPSSSS